MAELIQLVDSLLRLLADKEEYRNDLRGASPQRLMVIALLLLVTLCAGISCLMLYFVEL